jgi:putative endonuclease
MPPPSTSRRRVSPSAPKLPPRPERRAAELYGHRGETLAALFLRLKLYRIVTRRFKTPVGEIDLIVRRGKTTVFIEVKARRKAETEAETLESINRRRIVRAAEWYVSRHPALADAPLRFDVIFLAPGRWPRHIVNAFDAS